MILTIIQMVVALLLIVAILVQMQGSGLSASFGGSGESFRSRRSFEKVLVWVTAVLIIIFALVSVILLIPH